MIYLRCVYSKVDFSVIHIDKKLKMILACVSFPSAFVVFMRKIQK